MEKIPTANKLIRKKDTMILDINKFAKVEYVSYKDTRELMVEFAKLHVEAALKAASEEAFAISTHSSISSRIKLICENSGIVSVNRDSILNSYSLDNIK